MAYDLVIIGGTVVDGTGSEPRRADVGITGGRIVEVGAITDRRNRVLDAEGLVVTPGFIDAHTHMDAQLMWAGLGASSCWHGVTTVVMGNTGFSLAPSTDDRRDLVVRNLERAEDISGDAMAQGITWSWETFPEYLDSIDRVPKGVNYAANVGHSALRTWAMGERAFEEEASDDDRRAMVAQLEAALAAGAVGLTTSRSFNHQTADDRPVASRLAAWSELEELTAIVGHRGGILEIAVNPDSYCQDPEIRRARQLELLELAVSTGAPVTFGVLRNGECPAAWGEFLALFDEAAAAGGTMFGQAHSREISVLISFETRLPFDQLPVWKELRAESLERQAALLGDRALVARLVESADAGPYRSAIGAEVRRPDFATLRVLERALPPNPTVAEVAAARGCHPVEALIDLAAEAGLKRFFALPIANTDHDAALAILRHPRTVMTFSDSGAHVTQIMDSSIHTHFLGHWVREQQAFTLPEAVAMITSRPASRWGMPDRGILAEGYAADINVFDPMTVAPMLPTVEHDLPGGASRLDQRATGIRATVVGGEILVADGEHTGAMPGRLLRRHGAEVR